MRFVALIVLMIGTLVCSSCAKREEDVFVDDAKKYQYDYKDTETHINDVIGEEDNKIIIDASIDYNDNVIKGTASLDYPSVDEIKNYLPYDEINEEKKELDYDDRDTDIYWDLTSGEEEWYYDLQSTDSLALLDDVNLKNMPYIHTTNELVLDEKARETNEYNMAQKCFKTLGYDVKLVNYSYGEDGDHSQYSFRAVQYVDNIPFLFLLLGNCDYNFIEIRDQKLSSLVLEPRVKVLNIESVSVVSPRYIVEQIKADYINGKIQIYAEKIDEIGIGYTVIANKLIPVWAIYSYTEEGEKNIHLAYDAETGKLIFDEMNGMVTEE